MTHTEPPPQPEAGDATATALGRIPSGLFVVTWQAADPTAPAGAVDRGMLASWVMQAGFEPPMVTIAVAPARDLLAAIDQCLPFVLNVLGESQRPLLARFGRPAAAGQSQFDGLEVVRTPTGAAALAGVAAWLECRPVSQTGGGGGAAGDHCVVLARVVAASADAERQPLVHLRRNGLRY
jgi:flavin reductase (DIM6/NTAB) family NADH-FMN oxidoreductase RutF